MKQAQDISVYNYRMMQVMNDPEGGQGKSLYIKPRSEPFLWNRIGDLGWFWAGFELAGSTETCPT